MFVWTSRIKFNNISLTEQFLEAQSEPKPHFLGHSNTGAPLEKLSIKLYQSFYTLPPLTSFNGLPWHITYLKRNQKPWMVILASWQYYLPTVYNWMNEVRASVHPFLLSLIVIAEGLFWVQFTTVRTRKQPLNNSKSRILLRAKLRHLEEYDGRSFWWLDNPTASRRSSLFDEFCCVRAGWQ